MLKIGKAKRLFKNRLSIERYRRGAAWTRRDERLGDFLKRALRAGDNLVRWRLTYR